jgi:hypothetical protein
VESNLDVVGLPLPLHPTLRIHVLTVVMVAFLIQAKQCKLNT